MKKQSKTNLKAAASYRNGDIRRWMKAAKENYIEEKCIEADDRVITKKDFSYFQPIKQGYDADDPKSRQLDAEELLVEEQAVFGPDTDEKIFFNCLILIKTICNIV